MPQLSRSLTSYNGKCGQHEIINGHTQGKRYSYTQREPNQPSLSLYFKNIGCCNATAVHYGNSVMHLSKITMLFVHNYNIIDAMVGKEL